MLSKTDKAALKSLDGSVAAKRRRRCSRRGNIVRWGHMRKRIGRHLYRHRKLFVWRCNRYVHARTYWALERRNAYNHRLHGRTQWRWTNAYRRIGLHRYRRQDLYRNYQGRWRRVRGYWRLNRRNAYYRKPRWFWSRHLKRMGRHQYRKRCYKTWNGAHWRTVRCKWHLHRRNKYRHRLAGQKQWRWGKYKRVGRHRYRHRSLYQRDFNGRWKFVRAYWHKVDHNFYRHRLAGRTKWMWGRRYKRIGTHRYREKRLYRAGFHGNFKFVKHVWRVVGRNHYRRRGSYRVCRWRGPYKPAYSPGCSARCRQFRHLSQAKRACSKRSDCGGVTFEKHKYGWRWELRRGRSTRRSPFGETTYLKGRCYNRYRYTRRHRRRGRRLCAILYQHSNYRGKQYRVYRNVRFLRGFNDVLSSMRVYNCHVRLYQHSNYRGRKYGYDRGSYNYNTIRRTIGNDVVSSVRVWHHRRACTRKRDMVKWGRGRKRVGRHLYAHRLLYKWDCNRYVFKKRWWAKLRHNAYNHRLHGRLQWRWTNSYKRIGVHRYRYQSLYRNYQGRWRRVGGKWRLNKKNAYYRKPRYFWGGMQRRGRHQFRHRCLKRWTGAHWVTVRCNWHLHRRNAYAHRLAGQTQWRRGGYKRIGNHRYRLRRLYKRDFNGNWRFVRSYWHKTEHNYYGICARLYQHSNFHGRVYNVYHNVAFLRGFNDELSSMRVYNHCHVRLYKHSNYRGHSYGYGRGSFNYHTIRRTIGNDQASSIRVWRR